ncbi:coiled-coil domain-containing protein [Halorarum salinum]|uniref:Uncharacterized protein n=1 Tax=Halorarum salinum TaxID=2743089 RepID=A0A7D5LAZ6_9EURY|nr:hypothetical protein [Halobaculum salinum]QLG62392.1 hypothetical protein HUG12_11885 [Halobaculum salinum]
MTQGSDIEEQVVVEGDGVTVEKRFTADEFPVPAVAFTIRTERDDPAEFRLVDDIPEDFPMDRVGFHPEYESEHWTAYQDHRVEYRRRLEPGEEVTTVYGIRTDDPSRGATFLGEPAVEEVAEDADPVGDVADVIGEDSSQVVRDVLSGERESIPGDDGEPAVEEQTGEPSAEEPAGGALDLAAAEEDLGLTDDEPGDGEPVNDDLGDDTVADEDPADGPDDDAVAEALGDPLGVDEGTPADDGSDGGERPADAAASEPADPLAVDEDAGAADLDAGAAGGADVAGAADADGAELVPDASEAESEPAPAGAGAPGGGSVAEALATELREGEVSAEDRELLKRELELDHSTSVDARISRLQSSVEDLGAYTDALEEFVDENGTADELIEGLRADVTEVRDALDAVEADLAAADDERADLADDVADVRGTVDGVTDEVTETAEGLEASIAELRSEVEELAGEVAAEDDAVASVREGMVDLEDDVESLSATVDGEVGELRAELAEVRTELEEFEEFRDRLSSVFGPGGAAAGGTADGNGSGE